MSEQESLPSNESDDALPSSRDYGYLRVVKVLSGTLLLTMLLGNLVVYASPKWSAALGAYLPASLSRSTGNCDSAGCANGECPLVTSIGLPVSVLQAVDTPQDSLLPQDVAEIAE